MKLLDDYFALQQQIYDYFGYVADWVVIPLDDCTKLYWWCDGESLGFAEQEADLAAEDGGYFHEQVYTQRHLPKWVYEGHRYTMICADPQTDGNKFLRVFDNSKRREKHASGCRSFGADPDLKPGPLTPDDRGWAPK